MTDESLYYYANGKRIPLEIDAKHLGLDLDRVSATGLLEKLRPVEPKLTRLRKNVYLANADDLGESLVEELREAGALQPVFESGGGLMVALPEVRIEMDQSSTRSSLNRLLEQKGTGADIVRDRGEQVTIRPKTNSGLDALRIANLVAETVAPELAQVRFLRYLPKPGHK